MALADYRTIVDDKLRDTASKVTVAQKTRAVLDAVKAYSRVRERTKVQTITGDGSAYTFSHPSDWEDDVSRVLHVEYPAGEQDPEYVDANEYDGDRQQSTGTRKLHFFDLVLPNATTALVTYTLRHAVLEGPAAPTAAAGAAGNVDVGAHSWVITFVNATGESLPSAASTAVTISSSAKQVDLTGVSLGPSGTTSRKIYRTTAGDLGDYKLVGTIANNTATTFSDNVADASLGASAPTVDGAGFDTIPVSHREAVASLAACRCLRQLAAYYAQTADSTMGAESIDYGDRARRYESLADDAERDYREAMGIPKDGDLHAGASAIADLDVDLQERAGDRFFHTRRNR